MSIQEIFTRIKNVGEGGIKTGGTFLIIVLATLSAFGLGRLSAVTSQRQPISLHAALESSVPRGTYLGGDIVAARGGTSYYFPWCGGVENILLTNQVWFASEEEAKKAGYVAARNCRGLEGAK